MVPSPRRTRIFRRLCSLIVLASVTAGATFAASSGASEQVQFGTKMAQRGLWNEALFRFRQAEKLEPNNPRILNNIAVALEATGKFEDALAAYQQGLKADPANVELKRNYGRFAEFYQSFKPKKAGAAADAAKPAPVAPPAKPPGGAR